MPSLRSFSNGHDEFRLISEGGLSDARLGQPTVCSSLSVAQYLTHGSADAENRPDLIGRPQVGKSDLESSRGHAPGQSAIAE